MTAHQILSLAPWVGALVRIGPDAAMDEIDWDAGMIALVLDVAIVDDDVATVLLDFRPFMEHNTPLMLPHYYDPFGKPCITAIEANQWKDIARWYLPLNVGEWGNRMTPLVHALPQRRFSSIQPQIDVGLGLFSAHAQYQKWTRRPFPRRLAARMRAQASSGPSIGAARPHMPA